MDHVVIARSMFGTTMGFHIIFATLGVGIPLMVFCAECMYQRTKDEDYAVMALRWTRGFAVLLGVGIPTGTIAGVQLALLWPGFMEIVGKVISLPFQIELYAFFLEALFMSIYIYARDRLSPASRLISVFLVTIGAAASAVLISNIHAFEGTPAGFDYHNGQVTNVHPWKAFFNPSFLVTAEHVGISAFMTGAFMMATIASYKMLKTKHNIRLYTFHRKALMLSLVIGGIFSVVTALNGHESAQALHQFQPEKLAAAEGLFNTESHAPLTVGGVVDAKSESVKYGIEIPGGLSFLSGNRFDEVVQGLNDYPKSEWPPLFVHVLFNIMVAIGFFLLFLSIAGFFWRHWFKRERFPKWLMWLFVMAGPLAIIAIEAGWIFACTGRQPWIIYKVMLTSEAATDGGHLAMLFSLFMIIYLILAISSLCVLYFMFKRQPLLKELGYPEDGEKA